LSAREWILLVARRRVAQLHESPPVWLPDYAVAEARPANALALIALAFALIRELSGQADVDRAQRCACQVFRVNGIEDRGAAYERALEGKYNGSVNRCC
jgi:hypothetical protein